MKFLITLLFLSSCTISYYYKGKDLEKNQRKIDKQITKSLNNFDQINRVDPVIKKITKAKFKNKDIFLEELKGAKSSCLKHKVSINYLYSKRRTEYKKLKISKKKEYSSKNKKYKQIKSYVDTHDEFAKNIEEVFKKAQVDCGKIQKIFNKYDVKMMNANKLYGKFASYKKQLLKNKSKVTSKLKKFRKDLRKSKLNNKDKIEMELTKLEKILKDIVIDVRGLEKEVQKLKDIYGTQGDIPIIKGSEAYMATEGLKNKSAEFNKTVDRFNDISKNINKLLKGK